MHNSHSLEVPTLSPPLSPIHSANPKLAYYQSILHNSKLALNTEKQKYSLFLGNIECQTQKQEMHQSLSKPRTFRMSVIATPRHFRT